VQRITLYTRGHRSKSKTQMRSVQVGGYVSSAAFWRNVKDAIAFYQPFSDFIHQIEADRPALARVQNGIMMLQKHVEATGKMWEEERQQEGLADLMKRTFDRRLTVGSGLARSYQSAFSAAYLLDTLYGVIKSDKHVDLPQLSDEHEKMARELVSRVGGAQAGTEFNHFVLTGWRGNAAQLAKSCAV
jgi:hypothetical protein